MSFYRFCRITSNAKGVFRGQSRFVSSKGRSRSLGGRILTYGVLGTTVTVGGAVAYANFDPKFKQAMDYYLPGFGSFVDTSSEISRRGVAFAKLGWETVKPVITPDRGNTGMQSPGSNKNSEDSSTVIPPSAAKEPLPPVQSPADSVTITTSESSDKVITPPPPGVDVNEGVGSVGEQVVVVESKTVGESEPMVTSDKEVEVAVSSGKTDQGAVSKATQEPALEPSQDPLVKPASEPIQEPLVKPASEPTQEPLVKPSLESVPETGLDIHVDPALEAKKVSIENALQSLYQEFILKSDDVLASFQDLVQSMNNHYNKIKESVTSPPDNEAEIVAISEMVSSLKKKVDDASQKADQTKSLRDEVSKKLSSLVAEALSLEVAEELVEQICDKACEYQKSLEAEDDELKKVQADHASWLKEMQQQFTEERKADGVKDSSPSELPLADLDTQQETLLLMLRKKIENMEEEGRRRLAEALAKQQEEMQREFASVLDKERESFDDKLKSKERELDVYYEEKLKERLYQQADAYSKHLVESLQTQSVELSAEFEENFSKKLSEKEFEYQSSLAAAMARLQGIHSMISVISEIGKSTKKQHNIRTASDSLTSAFKTANSDSNPYSKHSISKEVSALREAAGDDEFLTCVLSSIPKQAINEGVASETGLIKRFSRVRKVCKRVALVGEEGGGLGTHLLSFVQSLLMFDMVYDKMLSRDYHGTSLDTYRLLSLANTYLEKGDLETCVRIVNQLSGEARRVAEDWVKEACLYLETRQAVMLVSEYLAASSYTVVQ